MLKAAIIVAIASAASFAALIGAPVAAPAAVQAKSFTIDTVHSTLIFRIRHNGVSNFYGRINGLTGSFAIDESDPTASSITCQVPLEKVDTANQKRDDHIRSPDFFNAKQFPTATFESTKIAKNSDGTFAVTGNLSLHGETREVTARMEYGGTAKGQRGEVAGFEATLEIKRADFGIKTYLADDGSDSGGLGNTVKIIISAEGGA